MTENNKKVLILSGHVDAVNVARKMSKGL